MRPGRHKLHPGILVFGAESGIKLFFPVQLFFSIGFRKTHDFVLALNEGGDKEKEVEEVFHLLKIGIEMDIEYCRIDL